MTERSLLPTTWNVPAAFRNRLGIKTGRQRAMAEDGHLLLVLHAPPKPEENDRRGRFFWRSPEGQWSSQEFGSGINALSKHLDEYDDAIARLDQQEQRATEAADYYDVLEHVAPICRSCGNLHHVLQDARKMSPDARELINLRDRAYELERTAELLFTGTQHALDYVVAKRVEEQADDSQRMAVAAHRLNVLAAFFLPIATLTAIFGVNLEHRIEDYCPAPIPFLAVLGLGLTLGIVLTLFIIRPSKHPRNSRR